LLSQILLKTMNEHAGSFGNAAFGDGFADASDTAGDDDDFVLKTRHVLGIR
jgi:hypothetical protein